MSKFDPYHKWLGIPFKEQPPNHYRLLGVDQFENDLDVIESAADKQMGFVRQYQSGENATEAARVLNELAMARLCLLKPDKKAEYDAKLRKKIHVPAKPDPEEVFADIPLPDVPASSIVHLPKRKRKSGRSKSFNVPPNVIKIGVAVAIGLVIYQFIPKGLTIPSLSEITPKSEEPPTPSTPPAQTNVAAIDTSAPPKSEQTIPESDSPFKKVAKSEPDVAMHEQEPEAVMPLQPKPERRPETAKPKATKVALDPNESMSVENELVGGSGGFPQRADLNGKTMIGVDWRPGEWLGVYALSQLLPVAAQNSPQNPACTRVMAPKGYAVGAIKVIAPIYVSSVQLVYMKINDDGSLDPNDTKTSKWLGAKPKGEPTLLSGEGKRLVGFHYRRATVVDAVGILIEP